MTVMMSFSASALASVLDDSVETGAETVARPHLRPDHHVPQYGCTRAEALADGLAAPWRVVSTLGNPSRLRSPDHLDAFSVHLLTDGACWSVVVIPHTYWHASTNRHTTLADALSEAPVAGSISELLQRYTDPDAAPIPRGMHSRREWMCADVMGLLLDHDYPDRDADLFVLALGGQHETVQERRTVLARHYAQQAYVKEHVDPLIKKLRARGIHRTGWKIETLRRKVAWLAGEHWNPATGQVDPACHDAVRSRLAAVLGNALDD